MVQQASDSVIQVIRQIKRDFPMAKIEISGHGLICFEGQCFALAITENVKDCGMYYTNAADSILIPLYARNRHELVDILTPRLGLGYVIYECGVFSLTIKSHAGKVLRLSYLDGKLCFAYKEIVR